MKWISVKDRLPINRQNVVVVLKGEQDYPLRMYATGYRQECNNNCENDTCKENEWIINQGYVYCNLEDIITHWMPLPEGPKDV